jgi:hypothetical protein
MKLYANPYDCTKNGFYFESLEQFEAGVARSLAEEFEIDVIETDLPRTIYDAMMIHQTNIKESFELAETLETLDVEQLTAIEFLLDCGHDIQYALDKFDDVCISSESLDDYAYGLLEDCYDVPENLIHYLDYRKFGRDLVLEGSVAQLNGYLITNANDF